MKNPKIIQFSFYQIIFAILENKTKKCANYLFNNLFKNN